jgi:Uma2 family endonuclease
MAAHVQPHLTPEQYLALDRAAELRSEYYDGAMYAMSGGSHPHAIIIGNLQGMLWTALRKSPCTASPTELRVQIPARTYVYPDVVVVCDEPHYLDGEADTLLNPSLVIEVLSPSTERHDRGLKSARYRTIGSLKEYALVSQSEPRVEIYRRQASGDWLLSESVGLEATCRFEGLKEEPVRIPLAEIYERVSFPVESEITLPSELIGS